MYNVGYRNVGLPLALHRYYSLSTLLYSTPHVPVRFDAKTWNEYPKAPRPHDKAM
ncbi:hypothetical protein D3C80_751500 [compost metagenome]